MKVFQIEPTEEVRRQISTIENYVRRIDAMVSAVKTVIDMRAYYPLSGPCPLCGASKHEYKLSPDK